MQEVQQEQHVQMAASELTSEDDQVVIRQVGSALAQLLNLQVQKGLQLCAGCCR